MLTTTTLKKISKIVPPIKDFDTLLKSCTNINLANQFHAHLLVSGDLHNIASSTRLVTLYANLSNVSLARRAFDHIPNKNVLTWNSMISAYVRNNRYNDAIRCFFEDFILNSDDLSPDFYTFAPVLKACGNIIDGKRLHCVILKMGLNLDVYVAASLIHMYSRFGHVGVARNLFDEMSVRDMGSWNAMISGYSQNRDGVGMLEVLGMMGLEGVKMDPVTIMTVVPVCSQLNDGCLCGMMIHLYAIKHGLENNLFVSNALIDMYGNFGRMGDARKVFDRMSGRDIVSWNSIISAYEQNDDPVEALELFDRMKGVRIQPDLLTLLGLASIFAKLSDSKNCKSVHGYIIRKGWLMGDVIIGNALVDMYAKSGFIDSARAVFDKLPKKDVISWNSLITGYGQNGLASEAIEIYDKMKECNEIIPNQGTWVSILPACSHVGALKQGTKIHALVIKNNLYLDVFVGTCLIDVYGKCGKLDDAMSLFYQIPTTNSVPWNAIIACHGIHGHGEKALELFQEMIDKKVKPDHVTFVSLLSACSHSGLVTEGERYFHLMQENFRIKPLLKHYGCMVDLYGRAGYLEKACSFIKDMPLEPDASIWGALLGACRIHGDTELGKFASDRLFEVDPENVGYYVVLSNIYANSRKWEGVQNVRSMAREKGLRKTPGWSSIELNDNVHVFYTGNQTHPKSKEIYDELENLMAKMKSLGYIPDYGFVLQDVEEDEKEHILTCHSERLAIAFGIISTPPKSTIRIFKNLRVCGDCHTVTKYISMITEREIIVRDSNRFHHFKDGKCSCRDYW
ncbi:hypothetical protein ACFE04_000998 [Oxalis oulophora]